MKLILKYTSSDGCTYSFDNIIPIEYDSEELLLCDFETSLDLAIENDKYSFYFLNERFSVSDFYDSRKIKGLPEIEELENWFEQNKIYKL